MKVLTLDIVKDLLGNSYLDSYEGRNEIYKKIIVVCTFLTPDMLRKLLEYDNFYISSFDNFPSVVIRVKYE